MESRSPPNSADSVADGNEDSREDDNAGDSENHNDCDSKIDDKEISYKLIDYEGEDQFVNSKSWNMRIKNPDKYSNLDEDEYYGDDGDVQDHAEKGVILEEEANEGDNVELNENNPKRRYKRKKEKPVLMWHIWEEETNKWLDENMTKDFDLDTKQEEVQIEYCENPSNMTVELLRYQREWLAWALKQECSLARGGILADEMGMGKTVQAIALVLAKRDLSEKIGETFEALSLPGPSTALAGVKGTLVICPTVAVTQWESEIDKCTSKGSTKVLVYHGAKREKDVKKFSEYDFVITTYGIVEREFRTGTSPSEDTTEDSNRTSFLHAVKWERIILDEAHLIKDKKCSTAKAIFALQSSYKWALSGTPFQNNVEEIFSLIRFLQISPYSFQLCKACDCRVLDFKHDECLNCPHGSHIHFSWWNKYIANPLKKSGPQDPGKRSMVLLKHKVLKSILLRRTKMSRQIDLTLPPKIVSLRKDTLNIEEQDFYKSLYEETAAEYNAYVQAGTLVNSYAHIFDLLVRLRQAVDHPYLVKYSPVSAKENSESGVGGNPPENPGRKNIKGFRSTSILNRIQLDEFETSTKIEALREEIRFMAERDGSAKGIVFSQFTSFLELINYFLQRSGIQCVQLVGGMTMKAKDSAIKKFNEDPDCRILLLNLKAGALALNLTVASHVFLMEPWWNPALERQAQGRVHRIGQYKPVRVVRFIIENTIDEVIVKLQDSKDLVFEGTMGEAFSSSAKFAEGLKYIFSHRWP